MSFVPLPWLVAVGVALAIVAAGGAESGEVWLLAAISGGVFADVARRAGREETAPSRDVTALPMAAGFFLILLAAAYERGGQIGDAAAGSAFPRLIGAAMIVAGVTLRRRSVRELGTSFGMRLDVRESHQLVETGPYRWIRHPNYSGLLLVALGTTLAWASPLALAATLLLWLPVVCWRMSREERILARRFGERYRDYARRTWRLVVGIY